MSPRYDYVCDCGNRFESRQAIVDRHTSGCRECGQEAERDIVSGIGTLIWNWFPRPPDKDGFTSKTYSTREQALRDTRPSRI